MTTLTPAAERLVEAAGELFYDRGIRAVGVDLIADRAGTTKKTLYDRFGSKDALVALYLERRAGRWQTFLNTWLSDHPVPQGTERVLAVFDALEEWLQIYTRGCGFVNAYAEIGGTDHPGLPIIEAEKTWMRDRFTELCGEAALPDSLGPELHVGYDGAVITRTAGMRSDAVATARSAAEHLITSAQEP